MDGGVQSAGSIRWIHELTIEAFSYGNISRVWNRFKERRMTASAERTRAPS
jgi:hypothetical protein